MLNNYNVGPTHTFALITYYSRQLKGLVPYNMGKESNIHKY